MAEHSKKVIRKMAQSLLRTSQLTYAVDNPWSEVTDIMKFKRRSHDNYNHYRAQWQAGEFEYLGTLQRKNDKSVSRKLDTSVDVFVD